MTRFVAGNSQAAMFDNVAFQPHTGNLVVLEDGEVDPEPVKMNPGQGALLKVSGFKVRGHHSHDREQDRDR